MANKDSKESKVRLIAIKISKLMVYAFWTFLVYAFALACHAVGENQHSFWTGVFGWWLFTIPALWVIAKVLKEDTKRMEELEKTLDYYRNKLIDLKKQS